MSCAPKLHIHTKGWLFSHGQGRIDITIQRGTHRFPATYLDLAYMASTVREEYLPNLPTERLVALIEDFSFTEGRTWPLSSLLRSILRDFNIETEGDVFDFLRFARSLVLVNEEVYGETGEGGHRTISFLKAWLTAPEGSKSSVVLNEKFGLKERKLERRCPNWMVLAHTRREVWTQ